MDVPITVNVENLKIYLRNSENCCIFAKENKNKKIHYMECCGLYYQCDINEYEYECTVYVYADEDYENYIDSFTVVGNSNYCEEDYLNRAYDSLFDMSNWYKEKIGYEVISNPSLPGIRV